MASLSFSDMDLHIYSVLFLSLIISERHELLFRDDKNTLGKNFTSASFAFLDRDYCKSTILSVTKCYLNVALPMRKTWTKMVCEPGLNSLLFLVVMQHTGKNDHGAVHTLVQKC